MLVVSILIYVLSFLLSFLCARKVASIRVIKKLPKNIHLSHKLKRKIQRKRNHQLFKKFIYLALMLVIPSLVAAFRTSGVDYQTYKEIFNSINAGNRYPVEFGWFALNYAFPKFEVVLFFSSLVFYFFSYLALKNYLKESFPFAWFFFLLLFSGVFYNLMRQMIAVAICFYALSTLEKKHLISYLIIVGIACLFHKSALFMVVIPLFNVIAKKIKYKLLFIALACALFVALIPAIEFIFTKVGFYSGYIARAETVVNLQFLLYLLPPLFFYYFGNRKFIKKSKRIDFCLNLYLLTIPLQFVGIFITYLDRMMLYFQPMIVVLASRIISSYRFFKPRSYKKIRYCYSLWFAFQFAVLFVVLNSNSMFPYR